MSTPEERLAALLRDTDVPVRGDGLQRIQSKLARRRWTRWVVPVAALATAGTAASVLILTGSPDRDTLTVQPGDTPSVTAEPSVAPTTSTCPPPALGQDPCVHSDPPLPTSYSYDGPFIWPDFGPGASFDTVPWAKDPQKVAQRFVTEFLKLDGVTLAAGGTSGIPGQGKDVRALVGTKDVSVLHLEQVGSAGQWVVTQAIGTGAHVTSPGFGESVTSPLAVTGTLDQAVDDNVQLSLKTTYAAPIAEGSAPAGSAVPWSAELTWTFTSWSRGAVVGITRSNKDGAVTRVFAQPVVRATGAEVATFVGIVDGHVSTLATDGSVGRQLTYPPAGSRDVEASFNGTSTLVVRTDAGTCRQRLIRLDGSTAHTVVEPGTAGLTTPRLSSDGSRSAWVMMPCGGGAPFVAVYDGSGPIRQVAAPSGSVGVEAVRDDGTALVRVGQGIYLVPPTATSVSDGKALRHGSGCEMAGAAFDGTQVMAWESCSGKVHLVRYDGNGVRVSVDPEVPLSDAPTRTSVNNGRVLVWLFGGDTVGEIARYQDGRLTTVVRNTGCTSVSEPKGCVREPSW